MRRRIPCYYRERPQDFSSSPPWPHLGWTCPPRIRNNPYQHKVARPNVYCFSPSAYPARRWSTIHDPCVWREDKEGKLVRKVRLVVNGKHHNKHGSTYASTPSREEFLILMHLFAVFDYDFYHIDENCAFLNAPNLDQIKTIAFMVILLTMRYSMRYTDSRHQVIIIKRRM